MLIKARILGLALPFVFSAALAQGLYCANETTPECNAWMAQTAADAQKEYAQKQADEAASSALLKVYTDGYANCLGKAIQTLDDGVSDAGTIAVAASAACQPQFDALRKFVPAPGLARIEATLKADIIGAVLRSRALKKSSTPTPDPLRGKANVIKAM